jgi:hypothetical protein
VSSRPGSGAVKTIAVLHIVAGCLGLLCSLCAVIDVIGMVKGGGPFDEPEDVAATQHMMDNVPGYFAVQATGTGIGLVFDVMLLSAGFGLLKRQPWARRLSIAYAALSILTKLGLLVYQFALVNPVSEQLLAQQAAKMENAAERAQFQQFSPIALHAGAFGLVIMMVYPAIVLIVMLLPSVAAYFRAEPDRYSDYDDEYPRRYRDRWGEDDRPRRWGDDEYGSRRGGWGDDYR